MVDNHGTECKAKELMHPDFFAKLIIDDRETIQGHDGACFWASHLYMELV